MFENIVLLFIIIYEQKLRWIIKEHEKIYQINSFLINSIENLFPKRNSFYYGHI